MSLSTTDVNAWLEVYDALDQEPKERVNSCFREVASNLVLHGLQADPNEEAAALQAAITRYVVNSNPQLRPEDDDDAGMAIG